MLGEIQNSRRRGHQRMRGLDGEGVDGGWDGWMTSSTRRTWVWVSSGCWWMTGKSGVLQSMGLQRVGHNLVTELNWTEIFSCPAPFVERTIFSVLHYLCSFLKFHSAVFTGVYFWTFCFVLLTYLHILSPIIACFDYYSFIMSLIFE